MCDKCVEIDRKILRLKDLARRILDQKTLDGIAALIAELAAQKADLHPRKRSKPPRLAGLFHRPAGKSG